MSAVASSIRVINRLHKLGLTDTTTDVRGISSLPLLPAGDMNQDSENRPVIVDGMIHTNCFVTFNANDSATSASVRRDCLYVTLPRTQITHSRVSMQLCTDALK